MRVAVLGAGTAGHIAATHFSHALPEAELLHVADPAIPTIGVGEGTTPRFPPWFEEVTGLGFDTLVQRCGATLKTGTRFEGWGRRGGEPFVNRFQPVRLEGWHFDAATVVQVLAEHSRAQRVPARVVALHPNAEGVQIELADAPALAVDYVFDARGFPSEALQADGDGVHRLHWIPTGRALLRRLPGGAFDGVTRAVARPHGWIFQIPLRDWTSSGYIFNPTLSTDDEVEADFNAFLAEEGVARWEARGRLPFPNFVRRQLFDGRVFRGGNAAGFLEPLEATALGTAIVQAREAAHFMAEHQGRAADADAVRAHDADLLARFCRDSLFLAWHYAAGSRWDTPFWRHASAGLARAAADPWAAPHLAAMKPFVSAGRRLPGLALPQVPDQATWDREVLPLLRLFVPYGNFSELNFAQVGHGLGLYNHTTRRPRTAGGLTRAARVG